MEYDFDCSYVNTTHVACAVGIDSEAPLGRGDLHLLLHETPASSGEVGFWVLPDISVSRYVPRNGRRASVALVAKRLSMIRLGSSATGRAFGGRPRTGASCPVADWRRAVTTEVVSR